MDSKIFSSLMNPNLSVCQGPYFRLYSRSQIKAFAQIHFQGQEEALDVESVGLTKQTGKCSKEIFHYTAFVEIQYCG